MSPADQEVLRLAAWEDLDGRALATALSCSVTAAAVRLHRARRRLQRALAEPAKDLTPGSAVVHLRTTDRTGETL